MTEYLIAFNDEWVAEHTAEQLRAKGVAGRAVIEEMRADGVLIFSNGGLDRSTAVCSVEAVDGKPVFSDGPYVETKEHLGGFAVVDVPDDATGTLLGRPARDRARLAAGGAPVPRPRGGPARLTERGPETPPGRRR